VSTSPFASRRYIPAHLAPSQCIEVELHGVARVTGPHYKEPDEVRELAAEADMLGDGADLLLGPVTS